MERYNDLRSGGDAVADGVKDGVRDGVREGVKIGMKVSQAVQEAVANGDFDFDFDFKVDDDNDWFAVGLDLLRLRRLDESIDAFENSIKAGEKESTSMYNIACAYSLKGDAATGMRWLDKAIEAGFGGDDKLRNDPNIALLRQQRGFDEIRRKAKDLEMQGCCSRDHDDDEPEGWREVVNHHRAMTQKYPNVGRVWFNLGFAALQARDFDAGIAAYQRTL